MSTRYDITITSGTAAFGLAPEEEQHEVAAILRRLGHHLDTGHVPDVLLDTNGNTVGTFTISPVRVCGICSAEEGEYPELDRDGWAEFSTNPQAPSPYDQPTNCHFLCIRDYVSSLTQQLHNICKPDA